MDDSESSLPDVKALSLSVSFPGWRKANSAFKSWAAKMSLLHRPTWQKAGIFEAIIASTKGFKKDTDLLLSISERWCPETKSFVFSWGEATITLEDVMLLLGFSVLGSPVFAALDSSGEEIVRELLKEWLKIKKDNKVSFVTQVTWMGRFMDSGDDLEHAAFLALWLGYFVFPTRYSHIDKAVLSIAVHLSRGTRVALAPPVLAHLYAELTLLKDHIRVFSMTTRFNNKVELSSLFKLVQVWTWERFRELRPNNTNPLLQGDPRLALWGEAKQKTIRSNVREILANSKMESFEWRPYTKAVKNWKLPKFYPEKAMWVPVGPDLDEEFLSFARCIKVSELVGIDSVEQYFPNRVASQFGLLQDVPCPVVNMNNLSKEAAWEEYNKPIADMTLFIPSRSAIPRVTSMFCEWWRQDKLAVELAESLTPRNIGRGYDDDTSELVPSGPKKQKSMKPKPLVLRKKNKAMCSSDENHSLDPPPKVVPLREVFQNLGKEFPENLKRSRYLRTSTNVRSDIVDCGGSASREVPLNELFQKEEVVKRKSEHLGDKRAREDCYDNITTAEMVIDREKDVRDASESLGERNNRLEDNNDSWMCQKMAHEDETVAQRQETGKNMVVSSGNGNNSSEPPLGATGGVVDTVMSCNAEIGGNGSNSEKEKTLVAGGIKEAKCVLHEDGENQRSNKKEAVDESLKETNLAEIALNLETRMMKVEKTLAKMREWKNTARNQAKNGISA